LTTTVILHHGSETCPETAILENEVGYSFLSTLAGFVLKTKNSQTSSAVCHTLTHTSSNATACIQTPNLLLLCFAACGRWEKFHISHKKYE